MIIEPSIWEKKKPLKSDITLATITLRENINSRIQKRQCKCGLPWNSLPRCASKYLPRFFMLNKEWIDLRNMGNKEWIDFNNLERWFSDSHIDSVHDIFSQQFTDKRGLQVQGNLAFDVNQNIDAPIHTLRGDFVQMFNVHTLNHWLTVKYIRAK